MAAFEEGPAANGQVNGNGLARGNGQVNGNGHVGLVTAAAVAQLEPLPMQRQVGQAAVAAPVRRTFNGLTLSVVIPTLNEAENIEPV
jgi:hypothetical protein